MQVSAVTNRVRLIAGCVAALAVVLGGVLILRTFTPTDASFYPKCMMYRWTGLHCPGCGTTRALAALAQGRLVEAIRFNPLLILGGPVILTWILIQRGRERRGAKAKPGLIWCLLAILVFYSLARNLPSPTRSILAPPASPEATREAIREATRATNEGASLHRVGNGAVSGEWVVSVSSRDLGGTHRPTRG